MNALTLFRNIIFPHLWLDFSIIGEIIGGIAGGLLSGNDKEDPALTGFAALPPQMQQALLQGTSGAQGLYEQGPQSFFGDQTFADLTPDQLAGLQSQLDYAGGLQPQLDAINQSFNQALNPNTLEDPAVQAMLASLESRGNKNLLENILPNVRRNAGVQGGEFGTRKDLTSGVAIGDAVGRLADAQGAFLGNQLASARGLQGQALGQSQNILNQGLFPGQIQQQVGGVFQGQDQLGIDEAMLRHNFGQQAPQQSLNDFIQNMVGLSGAGGTSSVQPGVNTGVSTISGALGGAAAGSAIASSFPNLFSAPQAREGIGSLGVGGATSNLLGGLGTTPFSQQSQMLAQQNFGY